ncbi:MAG: tripartite tricarboxylate transporter substrate binding protein [Betaproteobacteria bacterium]|nr:tripartite tricarboxylate transporter substrate binding protein [Betaproteobacteria bacterium]
MKTTRSGHEYASFKVWHAAGALLAVLLFVIAPYASAQTSAAGYPSRPIRFILPFPPGGGTDILGRILAQKLSEELGQPVVPENRPGAGGNVGNEAAAKSAPDGYTIVICTSSIAVSKSLYKKLGYDPEKDLTPIGLVASNAQTLSVHPSMPARSIKEMVQLARTHPGKVSFGTGGPGTLNDLIAQLFKSANRVNVLIVPYKGITPATLAMIGGHVDAVVIGVASAVPYVKSGKMRALATLAPKRAPVLPDVPTAAEAGYPDLEAVLWYVMMAPAGTPQPVVNRLSRVFAKIVNSPDTQKKMMAVGAEPMSSTPEEFVPFFRKEIARWGKVIREAGATAE